MTWAVLRTQLERLSFFLWIAFTIVAISLAGIGMEGVLLGLFLLMASSTQPVHFPFATVLAGVLGIFLSIFWRQVGVDHFHYLLYDSVTLPGEEAESPSRVLKELIEEVEASAGNARTDARARAKAWLLDHAAALDEEDISLAKAHFGYMLPAGWAAGPQPRAK
jgi:hypothetical protein